MGISIARVYEERSESRATRVLVDRLWPRGLSKDRAALDRWAKEAAPSTALRTWYGHDRARFSEFAERYRVELEKEPARSELADLARLATVRDVVLLSATRDLEYSGAAVLASVLDAPPPPR